MLGKFSFGGVDDVEFEHARVSLATKAPEGSSVPGNRQSQLIVDIYCRGDRGQDSERRDEGAITVDERKKLFELALAPMDKNVGKLKVLFKEGAQDDDSDIVTYELDQAWLQSYEDYNPHAGPGSGMPTANEFNGLVRLRFLSVASRNRHPAQVS